MEEYLPDDEGHSLSHLVLSTASAQIEIECGGQGDIAACRIRQVDGDMCWRTGWSKARRTSGWC